jgi:chromate transporter
VSDPNPQDRELPSRCDEIIKPSFCEAFQFWILLGCVSFGGPAGQIAWMHRELVDRRRWIDERHFVQAVQFSMLLPGPEAQQTATYVGWRLHGVRGGITAGGMFILPAAVLLYGLSVLFVLGQDLEWMSAIVRGLNAAVIAVILSSILQWSRRALTCLGAWGIAIVAFALLFGFRFSFVAIIAASAFVGLVGERWLPTLFPPLANQPRPSCDIDALEQMASDRAVAKPFMRIAISSGLGICVWLLPLVGAIAILGWDSTIVQQGLFFGKAALVTFGGAYAVLPYVAQQAVDHYAWLTASQMMAGLGLAESTPGPLIIVLQFVGFLGAWQHPDGMNPWVAGALGAAMTTWMTFVPSFIFILVGGPFVERLDRWPFWNAALRGITAAVIGGMASLGIRFALDTTRLLNETPDGCVIVLTISCLIAMRHRSAKIPVLVICCGLLGWLGWYSGLF